MEDLIFSKEFNAQELMQELFKRNLYLQAQVNMLTTMLAETVATARGWDPDKIHEELTACGKEILLDLIANDPLFTDIWKEKLRQDLEGIDGIGL